MDKMIVVVGLGLIALVAALFGLALRDRGFMAIGVITATAAWALSEALHWPL